MNLTVTGHHLEITPPIRTYIEERIAKIAQHFDHVIDVRVTLTVENLKHKADATVHVRGKDIHVEAIEADMYAAVDALKDKLDRQVQKHKEKSGDVHRESGGLHRVSTED